MRYNIDFLPKCIPQIRTGDPFHDKLIAEVPRVEKPKPDVACGIYDEAFTPLYRAILHNHQCDLAGPHLYDIFFMIEAKCINASIKEAENQCMRSGCAIVNTRRALKNAASPARKTAATSAASPEYPKVDLDLFAFTLAVGSQMANLFVNWALEMDSKHSV